MKVEAIAQVLEDALRTIPWLVRVESQGQAVASRDYSAWASEGSMGLASLDRASGEVVETAEYGSLGRLEAAPERVIAWAACVAAVLARFGATQSMADVIPAPALLAEPSLLEVADFERARLDVELEERCVAKLRG